MSPAGDQVARPLVAEGLRTFIAFDYGEKRTGVAVGSRLLGQAQPQGSIQAQGEARWKLLAQRIQEWQPDAIVVGVPYHPHENTVRAQKFGRQLHGRFALPVFEVDERYSTTEAIAQGARDRDAASACIILQQFLRSLV
jgi:putative Holliday junction resolvase